MYNDAPIGTVCAFAGQASPVSGDPNNVWAQTGCSSQNAHGTPLNPDVPLNRLEADGWMICDGRYLSLDGYPELFAVLGYLYGKGSVDRSFRIPDYRGLFLRGADAGSGMDPQAVERVGANGSGTSSGVGSLQCDAFETHTHSYGAVNLTTATGTGSAGGQVPSQTKTTPPDPPARLGPETRPKNIAVNYIIRFR